MTQVAEVFLWGEQMGAVVWDEQAQAAVFSYTDDFIKTGIQPSPLHMPTIGNEGNRFMFQGLAKETFYGLPGMLADVFPDKFGHAIIDAWLAKQGRMPGSMNPVEKLLYMGTRSMGALEFRPALKKEAARQIDVNMDEMLAITNEIMQRKGKLDVSQYDDGSLASILQIGTSAGGARPKGIVAIHEKTNKIISGHASTPKGFKHWIMKFDGVSDMELGKPQGYGRREYAYYLMALDAGISMAESKLWEEHGRAHFMTRRFDRIGGEKVHMQSLCGMAHFDYNMSGAYSYEQAMMIAMRLGLQHADMQQLFRRMVFNVVMRNQDDHTKNIAFLMGQDGIWKLSPAYDVTYSHNPAGVWTSNHQMSLAGKRDGFTKQDLISVANTIGIKGAHAMIEQVLETASKWSLFAKHAGVLSEHVDEVQQYLRIDLE